MVDLYADMFELAPVSLWLEDFSELKELLTSWRSQGITDLRQHLRAHPECVARCSRCIKVLRVNQRTLHLNGARDQQELTDNLHLLFRDDMHASFVEALVALSEGQLFHQWETLTYTLQAQAVHVYVQFSVLPGSGQRWDQLLVSMTDITARKQAEAEVAYLSTHDALTGLYNRLHFGQQMQRLDEEVGERAACTLLVIDVNGLKEVNESAGHPAGDALLVGAAQLLEQAIEPPMAVSRIGGDEFTVLMPGVDEAGAAVVVARLQDALAGGDDRPGRPGSLSLSIGTATRQAGETMEALLLRADLRMYDAKRAFYEARGWDRRTR